jgi:hypothetical protein
MVKKDSIAIMMTIVRQIEVQTNRPTNRHIKIRKQTDVLLELNRLAAR